MPTKQHCIVCSPGGAQFGMQRHQISVCDKHLRPGYTRFCPVCWISHNFGSSKLRVTPCRHCFEPEEMDTPTRYRVIGAWSTAAVYVATVAQILPLEVQMDSTSMEAEDVWGGFRSSLFGYPNPYGSTWRVSLVTRQSDRINGSCALCGRDLHRVPGGRPVLEKLLRERPYVLVMADGWAVKRESIDADGLQQQVCPLCLLQSLESAECDVAGSHSGKTTVVLLRNSNATRNHRVQVLCAGHTNNFTLCRSPDCSSYRQPINGYLGCR